MGREAPALYFLNVANPDREVAAPRAFLVGGGCGGRHSKRASSQPVSDSPSMTEGRRFSTRYSA